MPILEIKSENIVFDPKVQTYCINSNFICPSYKHSWACPPEAPYLENEIANYNKFFLVYVKYDLNEYIKEEKSRNPKRRENRIRNTFFMKNLVRDSLEQEIISFIKKIQNSDQCKLILWDGYCRLCSNEKDLGCTYDAGDPCRYPDKIRYSMEAVGIDVTKTVRDLGFNIEWPPNEFIYRFGLVCFK